MKKVLCVLLFLCARVSCAWGDVQINAENFPDDVFREYVSGKFDTDGNGILSDSEAGLAISADVSGKGIADLTGVKNLVALEILRCRRNSLTRLDVSGMQNLQALYCNYNSLVSLNVEGCSRLRMIECDNNSLQSLNTSSCSRLTHLYCYSNRLTGLDVSRNTALMYLWCYGNNITSLNLKSNTALKKLYCASNGLTVLDLSGNAALQTLNCSGNSLKALDLSHNTALNSAVLSLQSINSLRANINDDGAYYIDIVNDCGLPRENLGRVIPESVNGYVKGSGSSLRNVLADYDSESGIATFTENPVRFTYNYDTGAGYSMDVTFSAAPVITTDEPDNAYANRKYSFTFKASGAGSITWSINDESKLPDGMRFYASTGTLTGTPTATGKYTFTLTATSSAGSDTKTFTLDVRQSSESPESPVITTQASNIPAGYVNASYSFKFTASVSSGLTWRIEEGEIPGLSLATNGRLAGRPEREGSFGITVSVSDRYGGTDSQKFTVIIKPSSEIEGRPQILTTQSEIPDAYERTKYSFKFTASGQYSSIWSIVSGDIPGLGLASNGTLSGTPERTGVFSFTVQALMRSTGGTDTKNFTLAVKSLPYTPGNPVTPTPTPTPTPGTTSNGSGGGGGCDSVSGVIVCIGLCVLHGLRIKRRN